jgi:acyl carrier protein
MNAETLPALVGQVEPGVGRPVPERAEVAARLAEAWARHLGADPSHFSPTAKLVADLHFDDLDCVDALMAAEDEFDLVIEDTDAAACTTVDEYVTLVMRLIDTPACANYEPPNAELSGAARSADSA